MAFCSQKCRGGLVYVSYQVMALRSVVASHDGRWAIGGRSWLATKCRSGQTPAGAAGNEKACCEGAEASSWRLVTAVGRGEGQGVQKVYKWGAARRKDWRR